MVLMKKSNRIKEVPDAEVGKYQAAGYSLIDKKKSEKQSLVNPSKDNKNGSSTQSKADAL